MYSCQKIGKSSCLHMFVLMGSTTFCILLLELFGFRRIILFILARLCYFVVVLTPYWTYSSLRLILQLAYSFCSVEQSCKTVCSLILIIAHNVILFLQCSLVLLFFLVRMLLVSQELIYFMDLYSLTCCYGKWLGPFFFQLKSVDISQHGLNVLASGTV